MAKERFDLAVVGAGIAGLSAAHAAVECGASVVVIEAGSTPGGKMQSERVDGFLLERGPHSFRHNAVRLWQLIDHCSLRSRVVRARKPQRRYVFRGGRLRELPSSPVGLFDRDWLSTRGKLRLLAEPLVRRAPNPRESLGDFARRRLGPEAAEALLEPFISGIYAGDVAQLGAADAFPALHRAEDRFGSVILGVLRSGPGVQGRSTAPGRGVFTFDTGMGGLAAGIAGALPPGIVRLDSRVIEIRPKKRGFRLFIERRAKQGSAASPQAHGSSPAAEPVKLRADRVLLATPAQLASPLISPLFRGAHALPQPPVAAVALVSLGGPDFARSAPRGFGCLIGRDAGTETLGIVFASSSFSGRTPGPGWLHSVFVGGAHHPEVAEMSDAQVAAIAQRGHSMALRDLGAERLARTFVHVRRHRHAIAQYRPGYRAEVADFRAHLASDWPSIDVAGADYDGISLADAAQSGADAARRLLRSPTRRIT